MMRSCRLYVIAALAAVATTCAARERRPSPEATPAVLALAEHRDAFVLTWAGQRIGHATEHLSRTRDGYQLAREEHISIRRGERPVTITTRVVISLDSELRASSVTLTRRADDSAAQSRATRAPDGDWQIAIADQPHHTLRGDAVPLELLPLVLAREPRYQGTVMLAGYGFATAEVYARPSPTAPNRIAVSLVVSAGVLTNELEIDDHGWLVGVVAPGGVESHRAAPAELRAAFDPPELVDAASIPVAGKAPLEATMTRLILDRVAAPEPPTLPGQLLRRRGESWEVTLAAGFSSAEVDRTLAGTAAPAPDDELSALANAIVRESRARTPTDELRALARYTDRMIENDLAAPARDARAAFALGRGDCTAHATVFAAFAAARGFDVKLVTGYRLSETDGGYRLVRHRWAVALVDDLWIPIDPTYGEAPASPVLLGLAAHGPSAGEMAIIDELVFSGFERTTARFR